MPSVQDEWWKYTALDALLDAPWVPAVRPSRTPDNQVIDELAGVHGGPRLVFVDGTFIAELSDLDAHQDGISCTSRRATVGRDRPGLESAHLSSRYDGFQALNDLAGHDSAVVAIDGGVHAVAPIAIVHVSTGGDGLPFASHPRTTVEIGPDARATIIEVYIGLTAAHLVNARTTIRVGPRSQLSHYKVLRGRADASHVAHTRISVATNGTARSWSLLAGAGVARNAIDVTLRGVGATVELDGLYLPTASQRYDTAVTVEHAALRGTSRQRYRGVIDGTARGAFSGRVIVEAGTTGNDASQVNRCLLLAPTAEADSRPWLEIFADDVRCTHGAAIGRLDDEALFYLRTRGIPEPEARQLLVSAFVDELVAAIDVVTLRSLVAALVTDTIAVDPGRAR